MSATLQAGGLHGDLVSLVEDLLLFQAEVRRNAARHVSAGKVFSEKSVADLAKLKVDAGFVRDSFIRLCSLLEKHIEDKKGIGKLRGVLEEGKVDFHRLQGAVLSADGRLVALAAEWGIAVELLRSTSLNVFRPIFEHCLAGKINGFSWQRGDCPACGSFPAMSLLEKDTGRRAYWCAICSTQWWDKRLRCPACGNEDAAGLGFFTVEEGSPYRVDFCEKCRCYVKTIDERKGDGKERVFLVEDVKTAVLDQAAEKEGFKKPSARRENR